MYGKVRLCVRELGVGVGGGGGRRELKEACGSRALHTHTRDLNTDTQVPRRAAAGAPALSAPRTRGGLAGHARRHQRGHAASCHHTYLNTYSCPCACSTPRYLHTCRIACSMTA